MPKNVAGLNTDAQVKTDPVLAKHTIGIDLEIERRTSAFLISMALSPRRETSERKLQTLKN